MGKTGCTGFAQQPRIDAFVGANFAYRLQIFQKLIQIRPEHAHDIVQDTNNNLAQLIKSSMAKGRQSKIGSRVGIQFQHTKNALFDQVVLVIFHKFCLFPYLSDGDDMIVIDSTG